MDRAELQSQLTTIPGVLGVNLAWGPEESLAEVHVLADQSRKAREVMLDVKSLLSVVLQQQIDFRIISVAQVDSSRANANIDDEFRPPRVSLTAAYVKRLSGNLTEGVVELRLADEEIVGRSRSTGVESLGYIIARAFADALHDLLPSYNIRPRLHMSGGYCVADVQVMNTMTGESEDLVGAVKMTGDQSWDVSRAILSALNRRLEMLLLARVSA